MACPVSAHPVSWPPVLDCPVAECPVAANTVADVSATCSSGEGCLHEPRGTHGPVRRLCRPRPPGHCGPESNKQQFQQMFTFYKILCQQYFLAECLHHIFFFNSSGSFLEINAALSSEFLQ